LSNFNKFRPGIKTKSLFNGVIIYVIKRTTMKTKNFLMVALIILLGFSIYKIYELNNRIVVLEKGNETLTLPSEAKEVFPKNSADSKETNTLIEGLETKQDEHLTIDLFERAAPSVTFITTTALQRDFWTRNVTEIPGGTGSGFIWDREGHIVTNYHVIKGANKATVTLANNKSYSAELVGVTPEKDLAVLKIDAPNEELIPILVGKSYNLKVGQAVYAIGNPFGLDQMRYIRNLSFL